MADQPGLERRAQIHGQRKDVACSLIPSPHASEAAPAEAATHPPLSRKQPCALCVAQAYPKDDQAQLERAYRRKESSYRINKGWRKTWDVNLKVETKSGEHKTFEMKVSPSPWRRPRRAPSCVETCVSHFTFL